MTSCGQGQGLPFFPIVIPSLTSGSSSSACPWGAGSIVLTLGLGFQQTADGHEDHQPGRDAHRHGNILRRGVCTLERVDREEAGADRLKPAAECALRFSAAS